MPTHCCVPECTKKGYRDEFESKISYFKFPNDSTLRRQWLHAIRRDEGKYFTVNEWTKVCSRHFRESDFRKTLTGIILLKRGSVPSIFSWNRTSPRKRKPPTCRTFSAYSSLPSDHSEVNMNIDSLTNDVLQVEKPDGLRIKDAEIQTELLLTHAELSSKKEIELNERIKLLENQHSELALKVADVQQINESLKARSFAFETLKLNNEAAAFYTGFPNWDVFSAAFEYLDPGENGENIQYNNNVTNQRGNIEAHTASKTSKRGRKRSISTVNEFLLVMCRLRQGFAEEHLANLFGVSVSTVSRIFISWINFMYLKLGQINIWPAREIVDQTMPEDFKVKYKYTRVIIDCTEVRCQMPSSLQLNGELFSNYKNHTTLKGLVGISPGGAITFISQLYTGSISDREIVIRSGFLDLPFQQGDSVMADKGFTIEDILPLGVSLNIPPFLGEATQMSAEDVVRTQEIASLRIHVERAINKIKNFQIWGKVIPLHQFGVINQMWSVCAILCNAQFNIISA